MNRYISKAIAVVVLVIFAVTAQNASAQQVNDVSSCVPISEKAYGGGPSSVNGGNWGGVGSMQSYYFQAACAEFCAYARNPSVSGMGEYRTDAIQNFQNGIQFCSDGNACAAAANQANSICR
jgi:hypothetical protein